MEKEIQKRLDGIEKRDNVRILYACESGSRAWGFPSKDSDYDVRFIYVRPKDWYLRLDKEVCREVIEEPIEDVLDINGWDLKKTLRLLKKSNPVLMEWVQSPIVYRKDPSFMSGIVPLMERHCSPVACYHHYSNMARGHFRKYMRGDKVRTKKYFYVLRPLLAMVWIERGLGVVPMEFDILVNTLIGDELLKRDIWKLLSEKSKGMESKMEPRIDSISNFIEGELDRLEKNPPELNLRLESFDDLNRFFLSFFD